MVLAHSLRDNGTRAKLVALYTPAKLRSDTVHELRSVYDELIPVHSLVNGRPANLWLMDRPDLIATFTKIELWRLTQYERVVYIDCDVVAIRAPDELFALDVDFAAAPDVGWPDCFNSGLMVLRPNLQDYYALKALAERGISFDGADQGLLNMHFRDWHRLSFSYNCTPSANYQYIPAYRHFQSTISLIHFIGSQKPWSLPRQVLPLESPYNQLLRKWWAVYDKHYQPPFVSIPQHEVDVPRQPVHENPLVGDYSGVSYRQWPEPQHIHQVEDQPVSCHHEVQSDDDVPALVSADAQVQEPASHQDSEHHSGTDDHSPTGIAVPVPVLSAVPQYVRGEEHVSTFIPPLPHDPVPISRAEHLSYDNQEVRNDQNSQPDHEAEIHSQPIGESIPPPAVKPSRPPSPQPEPEAQSFEAPKAEWDASREPPPLNSKPEASSLEQKTYTMSEDTSLFQPPPSYPEAPKNMYYQVPPTGPEPKKVTQIFPWESHAPKPTRVFVDEQAIPRTPTEEKPMAQPSLDFHPSPEISQPRRSLDPPTESWESYSRSNAWDEDPEIQRYIESIQQARRARTQVISGSSHHPSSSTSSTATTASSTTTITGPFRPSIKLTDFPTEVERPSLPVTPAPIHPSGAHGVDDTSTSAAALPLAEGVPSQEDWVGFTVDAFSHVLRAAYLLWRSTESPGPARRSSPAPVGRLAGPGTFAESAFRC
ncbi:hypothetical protein N7512_002633 [Penicillium capsulatum]|nr:hypothetical protein N7512_002633 [Penicillium capsulatum]